MKLIDALGVDCIRTGVEAESRDGVLHAIAELLAECGRVSEELRDSVYAELRNREDIGSTGFGRGVAIPHCRVEALQAFSAGVLVLRQSVDFDAADGEPVDIVPFVVGPAGRAKAHLTLLSCLAQLLRSSSVRKSLRSADDAQEVFTVLTGEIPTAAPGAEVSGSRGEMRLVHVFVQDEDIFDEILQVFAATETYSAMVMEAHESTDYLAKTPLFAGFWDGEMRAFNRIIIATVRDELVNAVIRNIEYVCGRLDQREGIMVTVSPLLTVAGSLEG